MSWPSRPPPPLEPPPGRGITILRTSPGRAAVLSAAVLPYPGRRPGQIPYFLLKPTTTPQRGGPAVSRQYRNSVTLSGPPPPVPVPSPNVPSSPALSECCRPPPASHHLLRLKPSRGIGIMSLPLSVSHRRGMGGGGPKSVTEFLYCRDTAGPPLWGGVMGLNKKYGIYPRRLPGKCSMAADRTEAPPVEGRRMVLPLPGGGSKLRDLILSPEDQCPGPHDPRLL